MVKYVDWFGKDARIFREVNEAYRVIGDEELKKEYDKTHIPAKKNALFNM